MFIADAPITDGTDATSNNANGRIDFEGYDGQTVTIARLTRLDSHMRRLAREPRLFDF
jgi:hypothetical protein